MPQGCLTWMTAVNTLLSVTEGPLHPLQQLIGKIPCRERCNNIARRKSACFTHVCSLRVRVLRLECSRRVCPHWSCCHNLGASAQLMHHNTQGTGLGLGLGSVGSLAEQSRTDDAALVFDRHEAMRQNNTQSLTSPECLPAHLRSTCSSIH